MSRFGEGARDELSMRALYAHYPLPPSDPRTRDMASLRTALNEWNDLSLDPNVPDLVLLSKAVVDYRPEEGEARTKSVGETSAAGASPSITSPKPPAGNSRGLHTSTRIRQRHAAKAAITNVAVAVDVDEWSIPRQPTWSLSEISEKHGDGKTLVTPPVLRNLHRLAHIEGPPHDSPAEERLRQELGSLVNLVESVREVDTSLVDENDDGRVIYRHGWDVSRRVSDS